MRDTVMDSFEHPTIWDKMYSTGLAAFFCAQKTVMLPMTSRCGQNMVSVDLWPLAPSAASCVGLPDKIVLILLYREPREL